MQTSYPLNPTAGRIGLLAALFNVAHITTRIARGAVKAGYAVFRAPAAYGDPGDFNQMDPGSVYQIPSPAAAADADALIATIASAATVQTLSGDDLDGVVGSSEISPPRLMTVTFSSHADWDATTGVLTYYDENDQLTTENIAIPNGGNSTVTSTGYCSEFVSFYIPAQSGTGGTATVGLAVLDSSLTAADFKGVAVYVPTKEPASDTAEYGDSEAIDVLEEGDIWVYAETAMADGDTLYVRTASGAGGSDLGAFRNDSDSSTAVAVTGKVVRPTSGAGPCWVRLK